MAGSQGFNFMPLINNTAGAGIKPTGSSMWDDLIKENKALTEKITRGDPFAGIAGDIRNGQMARTDVYAKPNAPSPRAGQPVRGLWQQNKVNPRTDFSSAREGGSPLGDNAWFKGYMDLAKALQNAPGQPSWGVGPGNWLSNIISQASKNLPATPPTANGPLSQTGSSSPSTDLFFGGSKVPIFNTSPNPQGGNPSGTPSQSANQLPSPSANPFNNAFGGGSSPLVANSPAQQNTPPSGNSGFGGGLISSALLQSSQNMPPPANQGANITPPSPPISTGGTGSPFGNSGVGGLISSALLQSSQNIPLPNQPPSNLPLSTLKFLANRRFME